MMTACKFNNVRRIVSAILVSIALLTAFILPASAQRYWALMRDGEIRTGERLEHFDDSQRPIALDGQQLLEMETPARSIRNTKLSPRRPESFLEMTNGDVLAGRVVEAVTGERADPLPDHLLVKRVPLAGRVRVRLECVRRIATNRPRSEWTPGLLELRDGSSIQYRSLRWLDSELKLLTDAAALSVPFADVADLHLSPQHWQSILPAAAWLAEPATPVVRIVTADGQAMTFPMSMVTTKFDRKQYGISSVDAPGLLATKPPWALDSVLIDRDAIAWQSYFDPDETPLSTLPVIDVVQESLLHRHAWQRDKNARGALLHSGPIVSELGISMHSHTRMTFELPSNAQSFSSWMGLDQLAGRGGCVHCRIWRDEPTGPPLWEERYLTGADGVRQVGPLDISGAQRLVLEVDFAHENRPNGADPLDIRDAVNWLMPVVRFQPAMAMEQLTQLIPEIAGWSIDPRQLDRIELRPRWLRNDQWAVAIATEKEPLVLTRQLQITMKNAWLPVRATCDRTGDNRSIWVRANDEKVNSTGRGSITTFSRLRFGQRNHNLSDLVGETAVVEVVADPYRKARGELGAVIWDWLRPRPLIRNLPADGAPIRPDTPLDSLSPVQVDGKQQSFELHPGKLSSGDAFNVQGWPLEDGFEMPAGSELTYRLDPSWRNFVAVIGLAKDRKGKVGPYQILLDEKLHWSSEQTFARDVPAQQVSVSIPPGHSTMTLRLLGEESAGVWAQAGFLTSN